MKIGIEIQQMNYISITAEGDAVTPGEPAGAKGHVRLTFP